MKRAQTTGEYRDFPAARILMCRPFDMRHRFSFTILAALAIPLAQVSVARAQQPERALPLREAIAHAVRQNPGLGAKVQEAAAAQASVVSAVGQQDWIAKIKADWTRARRGEVPNIPIQQPASDEVKTSVGVSKLLP